MLALKFLTLIFDCFLLGSIPWGYLIGKYVAKKDIRNEGSGNIGTTNAMRTLGKKLGILVFVLDFCKGLLAAAVGVYFAGTLVPNAAEMTSLASMTGAIPASGLLDLNLFDFRLCVSIAFLSVVLGHIFSPWLGFKGGKGIAAAVGALFVLYWPIAVFVELAIFIVIVVTTKYVSAGSVACAVACPILACWLFWGMWLPILFCTLTGLVVIWAHRGNISRLLAGTERRIGDHKDKAGA